MEKAENEVTPNEARQQAAQGAVQDRASVPDTASLREYARAKLAIASRVRVLRDICRRQGSAAGERQCADLQVKLAEDRFTLAVLGLFKRGKSSLMNAILGRQALPTGVLPLTSTITVLRFGPVERLLVHRQGWALTQEAPLSDLATYVTEKGNPGNRMQVTTACLELPVPFLRRGVEFVDTPGVGSAIQANTATTYGFLPACDAALFVTSVDAPLTAAELEFLQRIRQYVHKVFFVVNKTDLLDDAERDEVLAFTRGAIARQVGDDAVTLHPLSARLGLAARLAGDTQAYARSGVAALEEALAAFLADERAATFLEAVTDKAERLLAEEQDALELRLRSRQLSESARAERAAALHQSLQSHRAERQNLVREARGSAQSAARAALETEMAAYLREAASALAVDAERLLRRYPWWPAGAAMARLRRHCRRRMSADGWQWVLGRTDMLSAAAQAALDSRREALAAAIARIPSIAASVMGLGDRHTPAPADLADWRAVVHLPHQALDDLPVNAAAPAWFWCLPARVARGTLVRTLREALAGFSGACLRRAAEAAAVAVDSTTARAAEAVEEQALAAERSALASLNAGPAGAEEDAAVGRALEELRSRFAELPGAERPAPAGASGAQAPKRAARPAPVSDGVRRPPEGAPVRPGTGAQVGAPGCPGRR